MNKVLSIGDVANLRSGGPDMTVLGFEKLDSSPVDGPDLSSRGHGGLVRCVWFDEGARMQSHAFPHGLLDMKSEAPDDKRTDAEEPHDKESLVDKFRNRDREKQSSAAKQDAQAERRMRDHVERQSAAEDGRQAQNQQFNRDQYAEGRRQETAPKPPGDPEKGTANHAMESRDPNYPNMDQQGQTQPSYGQQLQQNPARPSGFPGKSGNY